jgi:hypothetical protein
MRMEVLVRRMVLLMRWKMRVDINFLFIRTALESRGRASVDAALATFTMKSQ